jgi:hypothetical protein
MVPIHDTDVAEERWSQAEWERFELWEKVEIRLRRRKWLWILGTAVLFVSLSSIPIVIDRRPKWRTLSVARQLAQEINHMKRDASVAHQAHWLRFAANGNFDFRVERGASCQPGAPATLVREGIVATPAEGVVLLDPSRGGELGIPGLVTELCYDPLAPTSLADGLHAFGIVPVKDLAETRGDRVSIVLLKGEAAEASFE